MDAHDELEAVLHAHQQVLAVVDIDVELPLDGVVDQDAGLHANLVVLRIPVGFVRDGYSLPSVGVHVSQAFSHALDDSLGKHMRLLVQMMVVGVWVVETSGHYTLLHYAHWLREWLHLLES